jgi:hypothetical protein
MSFYKTNFNMKEDWGYSYSEINDMMPYERELELLFIMQRIEEQNKTNAIDGPPSLPTKAEFNNE